MSTVERTGDYQKLEGKTRMGDFVHQGQTMSADVDFKNVSRLWYDQTIDFDKARETLSEYAELREDIMVPPTEMVPFVDEVENIVGFKYGDRKFIPNEHAWNQFSTRCYMPTSVVKWYLRKAVLKPNGEARYNFDNGDLNTLFAIVKNAHRHLLQFAKDSKLRFRVYNPDENASVGFMRACLTEDYAPIDNEWYLNQLERLIPGGRVSHFNFSDADTLSFNVLIPDSIRTEDDSDYGGMISAGNCEICTRRFEQWPSVFRAICMNGCIWDQEKGKSIRQVHRGKINLKELADELEANIHRQIPLLTCGIDLLLATREWKMDVTGEPSVAARQILAQVADTNGFSGTQTGELFSQFALHERKNRNAFGVINAVTRAGQAGDSKFWVKSDRLAGKIMEGGEDGWNKILKRAATITDEEITKLVSRSESLVEV